MIMMTRGAFPSNNRRHCLGDAVRRCFGSHVLHVVISLLVLASWMSFRVGEFQPPEIRRGPIVAFALLDASMIGVPVKGRGLGLAGFSWVSFEAILLAVRPGSR